MDLTADVTPELRAVLSEAESRFGFTTIRLDGLEMLAAACDAAKVRHLLLVVVTLLSDA